MSSKPLQKELTEMNGDVALIADIGAGNKQALGRLVEKHKRMAFLTALGLVGNKDDAHDISQEAFLRVYQSAKTFDQTKQFKPWFYTIIANLSRTWLKRRTTRDHRMTDVDDISYLLVDPNNPESELIKNETISRLRISLLELSFEDREIITLQAFRGMSYDEIANLLDIPKGTVMSRLYYARKKLAKLMGGTDE